MLRVIIADDEERVCRLIQALADWKRLGMEVAGIAGNGLEALEFVRALTPDILITDIRMPGYSGLELISRAREIAPALEVIIISGYAQFDYAQTAIQYGVGEYLLKPINKDALNGTLEKMGERCRARRASELDIENLRLSSRDDHEQLRNRLVQDLIDGRYAAKNAAQLEQMYHFHAANDAYQVLILKMDYDIDQFQEPSLQIVRNKAEDIFRPVLTAHCGDFALGYRDSVLIGVLHYRSDARDLLRGPLRECLNQLVALTSLFGPVVFSMALGQPVRMADTLSQSYESARRIITERLIEGTGRLLERQASASNVNSADLLARYAQDTVRAIDALSQEAARSAADVLEQAAAAAPGICGWELTELVRSAGTMFVTRLGVEDRERWLADFSKRCGQCATPPLLFACLQTLQQQLLAEALEQRRNQEGQPVRLAKQYIHKHFAEPLTLEDVAAATGFSVHYFSTLFKKENGEGFNKYLARVRVDEARRLLRETREPVLEICRHVGYADLKHFTHTFKSITGVTPGEFRKLYG